MTAEAKKEVALEIGAILHLAHRQMETLATDREVMHLRDSLVPKYSELVYNGFWFSPEREALQALAIETQRDVTGVVRVKLYKGNIIVAGRKSPKSLYDPNIATRERDSSAYDQNDATGFIRLNGVRLKLRAATGRAVHLNHPQTIELNRRYSKRWEAGSWRTHQEPQRGMGPWCGSLCVTEPDGVRSHYRHDLRLCHPWHSSTVSGPEL